MRFSALIPMLQTTDMTRTIEWYQAVLNFSLSGQHKQEWCRLVRDDVSLMFMHNAHLGAPHATATQYIYVDDVFGLWSSLRDHCSAEWGPTEMSYGMLEFAIRDPNGSQLRPANFKLSHDLSFVRMARMSIRAST